MGSPTALNRYVIASIIAAATYLVPGTTPADIIQDDSFGQRGIVRLSLFAGYESVTGLVVQDDGDTLAVGGIQVDGSADIAILRVDAAGHLDTSFGDGGYLVVDLDGAHDVARAVTQDSAGRTVVVGKTDDAGFVLRLDQDGRLDPSFADGGVLVLKHDSVSLLDLNHVVTAPEGKLTVTGRFTYVAGGEYPDQAMVAVRLIDDGSLDPSFGDDGFAIVWDVIASSSALLVDPEGRVVLAGSNTDTIVTARLTSDGSPDLSFGDGGVARIETADQVVIKDIVETGEGRYVLAALNGAGLFALDASGQPFTGFGPNGQRASASYTDLHALAVDAKGQLWVAGSNRSGWQASSQDSFLALIDVDDGDVIESASTDIAGLREDVALDLGMDALGRLTLGGYANNGVDSDFAFARLKLSEGDSDADTQSSGSSSSGSSSGSSSSSGATANAGSGSSGGGGASLLALLLAPILLLRRSRRRPVAEA